MDNKQPSIKDIIKQEYAKCAADPVYFMKKYVWIQNEELGRIKFNLYPYQEKVLKQFFKNDYTIVLKSRQIGLTTLAGPGYALWLMLFHKDKSVLVLATKQETARIVVDKVIFAYDNLPSWLKIKYKEKNKLSLHLTNGSKIKATSSATDSGRSNSASLLILDECAFIPNAEEIWGASQQTLAKGGKAILLSTPNGTGNFFHKTWEEAETGDSSWTPLRLPWYVHPGRDQKWRDRQDELLGKKLAAQECDCDFMTSGDTVLPAELLKQLEKFVEEPVERRGVDKNLWIWEYPDYTKHYMITCDVARGDGNDYSTFHVIDIENLVQVAEYRGQLGTTDFAKLIYLVGIEYNNALAIVDNLNIGWATLEALKEMDYPNIFYSSKKDERKTSIADTFNPKYEDMSNLVPGYSLTPKNRPMIIAKLVEIVEGNMFRSKSSRLYSEYKTFIWKNGKPEAQQGYNDDLVVPLATGLYLRDTALVYKQKSLDLTRAALRNTGRSVYNTGTQRFGKYGENPWKMNLGNNNDSEDITWLL